MMKKTLVLLLLMPFVAFAQEEHYMGCLFDDEEYARIPMKPFQLTQSYSILPSQVSLLQYCPTPASQGPYGTCTSWAIAYAARTIMEAQLNNCTDASTNAKNAFSPSFVYAEVKHKDDPECKTGISVEKGMKLLKELGVPKKATFHEDCASFIPEAVYSEAANYKIEDYFRLFNTDDIEVKKILATKMALSQGRPIVIGMECYRSFHSAKDVWNGNSDGKPGSHAMCVVGYDDDMFGGAFMIMNSWGAKWGQGGFIWVTYRDYAKYVKYGYEMYLGGQKSEADVATLSGSMEIKLVNGEKMPVALDKRGIVQSYKVPQSYPSGTRYRIFLSNNEPAYVYVLESDIIGKPKLLFPPSPYISPALVYASNNIAIPDEKLYIETDNKIGADYLCVLYSQSSLSIDEIMATISSMNGTFPQKVVSALGSKCVVDNDISYETNSISFSTHSTKTVVPIIVEIPR